MNYCPNCKKGLNDNAQFCDACGTKLNLENNGNEPAQTSQTNTMVANKPKSKRGLFIGIIAIILLIVLSYVFIVPGPEKTATTESDITKTVQSGETDSKESILHQYFSPYSYLYLRNAGTVLLRNPAIFQDSYIYVEGVLENLLPSDTTEYSCNISFGGIDVPNMVVNGTYNSTEQRYIEGDRIDVLGKYTGIESFETVSGNFTNAAVLNDCCILNSYVSIEDFKKVATEIFGNNLDIRSANAETLNVAGLYCDAYEFTTSTNGCTLNWLFDCNKGGACLVSLDGGLHYSRVYFTKNYKKFFAVEKRELDGVCVVKYFKINGEEISSNQYSFGTSDVPYILPFVITEKNAYLYLNDYIHVINLKNGIEESPTIPFKNGQKMLQYNNFLILIDENDEITVTNLEGSPIFTLPNNEPYFISQHTFVSGDIILVYEPGISDDYPNRYVRINLETGNVIGELTSY